ncbi:alpha/beta family hydrolase [Lichenicoccus sp.]|uniref:alpha/beta hydrolase family protein n=1 Tax=Lichenicoccus sp. TaxID=2781899 RepID=UPI003D11E142
MRSDHVAIQVDQEHSVSGLLQRPTRALACCVLAHGAGAGMTHPFMTAVADGLAERGVATLRYQFPAMERGSTRPDRPALAQATVRAAVEAATGLMPALPLVAGGKSFGGRMTSQAQADQPLAGVRGLVFLGFPPHTAKKPSIERAGHLPQIHIPMLFVQGTREALADMRLLTPALKRLGPLATLMPVAEADHSFHVPVKSGQTDHEVLGSTLDAVTQWIEQVLS